VHRLRTLELADTTVHHGIRVMHEAPRQEAERLHRIIAAWR
jgi:hypothetical protein